MFVSEKEVTRLRQSLKDENVDKTITLATGYWIRMQVFMRYVDDYLRLTNKIKKERELFELMYNEIPKEIL